MAVRQTMSLHSSKVIGNIIDHVTLEADYQHRPYESRCAGVEFILKK